MSHGHPVPWLSFVGLLIVSLEARADPQAIQGLLKDRFGQPLPAGAVARFESAHLRELESARLHALGRVIAVAFSPDGRLIYSAGDKSNIRIWEAASGNELPPLPQPMRSDGPFVVTPNGKTLVAFTRPAQLHFYDLGTGKKRFEVEGRKERIYALAHASNGNTMVTGSEAGLRFWDTSSGQLLRERQLQGIGVRQMAFAPDGKTLALACTDGSLRFWDAASAEERRKIEDDAEVMAVVYSPDGKRLATQTWNGKLRLRDAASGQTLATLSSYGRIVAFAGEGRFLVTGEIGGVCLRDAQTGKELDLTSDHYSEVTSVAVSPDGQTVAWANNSASLHLARIRNRSFQVVQPEKLLPRALAFTANGKELVTVGDAIVRVWDTTTSKELRRWPQRSSAVPRLAPTADGRRLALGCEDRTVRLVEASTGKEILSLPAVAQPLGAVAFSPDGTMLATGHGSTLRLWDATTGQNKGMLKEHAAAITALVFTPDSKRILSASEDRTLRLWDSTQGIEQGKTDPFDSQLGCLALTADGKTLALGDWEGKVRLLSVGDSAVKESRLLAGHKDNVSAVAFAPDGRLLASASWDHTVRLWEVATGKEVKVFAGHLDEVDCLAFSPDGQRLVSGSRDHTLLIWDVLVK